MFREHRHRRVNRLRTRQINRKCAKTKEATARCMWVMPGLSLF